jgi:hypothetical protein
MQTESKGILVRAVHIDRYTNRGLVLYSRILGTAITLTLSASFFHSGIEASEFFRLPVSSPNEEQEVRFA